MKNNTPGQVDVIYKEGAYIYDPLSTFAKLIQNGEKKSTLLLEAAEIDTKYLTRSIMLLDAALEIRASGRVVTVTALSANGQDLYALIEKQMPKQVTVNYLENRMIITFPEIPQGVEEEVKLKAPTPMHVLRILTNSIKSQHPCETAVFLGGLFGYEMIASIENLPDVSTGDNPCPDMKFYLAETMLVVDHNRKFSYLSGSVFSGPNYEKSYRTIKKRIKHYSETLSNASLALSITGEPSENTRVETNIPNQEFCQIVEDLKKNIIAGDIFQVVPSRNFKLKCSNSLLAYEQLKKANPSPYMFYMNDSEFTLFGASPETALRYQAHNREVEVYPIAGTRRRGRTADGQIDLDLDSRIELELRCDEKELAEHLMLVDLARNDIARISEQGSRHVAKLLKVDRYSHVMHLVSQVVGKLRHDLDALHAYQACMNMGTLTGAPKIRASELIRQVEKTRRGSYGGAIGFINGRGDMETCIVIRSACVVNGVANIQAGAGIVYDSVAQNEADETLSKAQSVISAVLEANKLVNEAYTNDIYFKAS